MHRYQALFRAMETERPTAVLLGGDLLPSSFSRWAALPAEADPGSHAHGFFDGFLLPEVWALRTRLGARFPKVLLILGNDDLRSEEGQFLEGEREGLWSVLHGRSEEVAGHTVYGYSCVPPTPFLWKDWERYDVSRYTPPGCVSPEEGWRTVEVPPDEVRYGTIKEDLEVLASGKALASGQGLAEGEAMAHHGDMANLEAMAEQKDLANHQDLSRAIFLFHTPPSETNLDRAALDGKMVDHVPLDLHVGSIAVRRFIEARQPLLTLHGHIHESAGITGSWRGMIGRTHMFSGAHDGPELALVRFHPEKLDEAARELL